VKDFSKPRRMTSKGGVKQIKGPGMNKGLKKPRRAPGEPKDYGKSSVPRMGKKRPAFTGSYLPDTLGLGRKKSKP
jgi:hypothetical protein